ncbi:inositol monophosphatase family protein [Parvularcula dongshanensis]|uniref:Inositol-1-monophosphatase n=1 Tax=Parvularcula dongshanensis TaxID=1173995 RepID=A0A840I6S5_9PROT|nr:inositol monophosphatase family protein [Parvularcula dongshanensis]MBB4659961.1 myo-inositol-1(or 4)-monophosphatase [Parvularcula dongshanensis]
MAEDFDAVLHTMTTAARAAGAVLGDAFGRLDTLTVERKKPSDFVSEADLGAERAVFDRLRADYPRFGAHLEEGGIVEGDDPDHQWIVDPLDGTTNFLRGIPHFSVSIALARRGRPVAGVVLNPASDEIFVAAEGRGTTLNGRPVRVAEPRPLAQCLFGTGLPFRDKTGHEAFAQELVRPMKALAGIRRFGSAALDLAWVACGRFDAFWEHDLSPWDVAAGILLIREAGGLVTLASGEEADLPHRSILASGAALHDEARQLVTCR